MADEKKGKLLRFRPKAQRDAEAEAIEEAMKTMAQSFSRDEIAKLKWELDQMDLDDLEEESND